jgi:hypothetical protein
MAMARGRWGGGMSWSMAALVAVATVAGADERIACAKPAGVDAESGLGDQDRGVRW